MHGLPPRQSCDTNCFKFRTLNRSMCWRLCSLNGEGTCVQVPRGVDHALGSAAASMSRAALSARANPLCTCHSLTRLPPNCLLAVTALSCSRTLRSQTLPLQGCMGSRWATARSPFAARLRCAGGALQLALGASVTDRRSVLDVRPDRHTCTCHTYTAGHAFACC